MASVGTRSQVWTGRQTESAPFYSIADLEQMFRVSNRTVYRWIERGLLRPIYLDIASPRFDAEDVARLIESRRGKPRPRRTNAEARPLNQSGPG
jgi:hypothetical protein